MRGDDLVSAITLAGAAEEILDRLAKANGKTPSLDKRIDNKIGMFKAIFPKSPVPDRKEFARLSNLSKNAMKHLTTTKSIQINLEEQAGRLLARAVENYVLLFGGETPLMRRFQSKRLRAYRTQGVA